MDNSFWQGKGSDPYFKVVLGGTEIKTETIKGTKTTANFYETLYVTLIYPTFIDQLTIALKDWDNSLKSNEYFGTQNFNISAIKRGDYSKPFWGYVYGAFDDVLDKEVMKSMN
jgi:hypothetical protein